ncbi:MAG: hypothetical protein IE936_08965 [Moraxella osloensis]|nr:hypothetical protein [Moraxella osloensis]
MVFCSGGSDADVGVVLLANAGRPLGFVHQEDEFFISESESKDLLARLDSDSPVTRLPDNHSEEAFLAFIQS